MIHLRPHRSAPSHFLQEALGTPMMAMQCQAQVGQRCSLAILESGRLCGEHLMLLYMILSNISKLEVWRVRSDQEQ